MKPFNPDQIRTFRAPKYTGVTLSLLSMFVLASMMVVWNQMEKETLTNNSLKVYCDESFHLPLKEAAEQFKNELQIQTVINFYTDHNFHSLKQLQREKYDILISEESNSKRKKVPADILEESIMVANASLVFATKKSANLDIDNLTDIFDQNITFGHCKETTKSGSKLDRIFKKNGYKIFNYSNRIFNSDSLLISALLSSDNLGGIFINYQRALENDLKIYRLKEFSQESIPIECHILKTSEQPTKSLQFARFLAAPTKGQYHFANNHFIGVDGDTWRENPAVKIFCEPPFKTLFERTTETFKQREGANIKILYPISEKLIFTLSSISQSSSQNLLPDLLVVSTNTSEKLSPNYIEIPYEDKLFKGKFFFYRQSKHRSLCKRFVRSVIDAF